MDTDQANGDAKQPVVKTRKVKKQVRKGDLPLSAGTASLDTSLVSRMAEQENSMVMEDKLVADTEDKKNELESFIYELRNKIDEQYSEFASDDEKSKIKDKLEQSEVSPRSTPISHASSQLTRFQDWLYDEGEDATKAVYVSKIEEIRSVAGPIVQRYNDKVEEERQAVLQAQEEAAAKKRAEQEAKRRAEDEKKKADEAANKPADQEMTDAPSQADGAKPDEVEESAA